MSATEELRRMPEKHDELLKDADGVPIRVGDMMDAESKRLVNFEVREISLDEAGWEIVARTGERFHPSALRHRHKPTVENLLREFAERWDDPKHNAKGELVEEYAAKLRLAGDGE